MRNKMGLMTTLAIGELELTLEDQVGIHLRSNLYPPVPLSMVQPCVDAINAIWNEDYFAEIELPEGVLWRGSNYAPASAIVEGHRLDGFVMEEDWEDE
jgi:hypothetical protein